MSRLKNHQHTTPSTFAGASVPETNDDKYLKKQMAEFLSVTGQDVTEEDIDVVHRLKKKTTVIMEFKN